ncbi:unnamed protein product [Paramecium sonneborni]|uniref:WD40-repeat-containing domain n=1 Tax=Paramecium sonneborni TaxID=65129 RepID=A0A8S1RJN4_9CILI|nr:unnamed protein product [Paramecium sonneborni]
MISTINKDIKVWNFINHQLYDTSIILKGHQQNVYCLVYSKISQWFISGGFDQNIIIWKQINEQQWESTCICNSGSEVFNFYLNKNEDQLFSSHLDGSIKIWLVSKDLNSLSLNQTLHKHKKQVGQISINEEESQMVSCSSDKKIIIWEQDNNKKWQFKYFVNKTVDDSGERIIYLDKDTITWKQIQKGIIHIFHQENNIFVEKKDQQINLKAIEFADYMCLCPFIFNRKKQILIIKHHNYMNIFKYENSQLTQIEEPIQFENFSFFGNLTQDGKFLVIWISQQHLYRVYQLFQD